MMTTTTSVCVCCDRTYAKTTRWSRGLSPRCRYRHERAGTLEDYPPTRTHWFTEWYPEYTMLRMVRGLSRAEACAVLGMSRDAVDRALIRYRIPVHQR